MKFQAFQWDDIEELSRVARDAWELTRVCGSEEEGLHRAKEVLLVYLAAASYGWTAWENGRMAGFILARKSGEPLFRVPRALKAWQFGRTGDAGFREYKRACEDMAVNSGMADGDEMVFFAVMPEKQRKGIGRALYSSALEYLKEKGSSGYFLCTDSSCSYQFYERRGMERVCESVLYRPGKDERPLSLHLYRESGGL